MALLPHEFYIGSLTKMWIEYIGFVQYIYYLGMASIQVSLQIQQ